MKKLLLTIAVALISVNVNSQEDKKENRTDFRDRFMLGFKAGANYSNVYDSEGEAFQANPKLGLATGLFGTIPIGTFLGIQPEILISQKGFQGSGNILGAPYNITRTTTYLDIPIMFAFKPSEFITLLAGPQFAYLLKQTDVFANGVTTIEQEKEFENDNVRKNTLCFLGGADITMKHVVLSGRAGWDLQKNNGDGTSTTPRYKNMWYQVTIGYRFYKI